jgi:hypothetical protein
MGKFENIVRLLLYIRDEDIRYHKYFKPLISHCFEKKRKLKLI